MAKFTIYLKRKRGSSEDAAKAITLLKTYLQKVIEKSKDFDDSDALLVESDVSPALGDTDVIVYMVKDPDSGVIKKKGGDVSMASGDTILGLTDLNLKICEIYYDRIFQGSAKEIAGATYHEAAHIKSNQTNVMHDGKDGFLKGAPDYNGSPTDTNNEFLAKHLAKKVTMTSSY